MKFAFFPFLLLFALSAPLFSKVPPPPKAPATPIGQAMQTLVDQGQLSGAVTLVWKEDTLLHHEAVGYQDINQKTPMAKDSLFWIASMTKPITAIGVMMLVEEKKLSLDAPISTYLPEFKQTWVYEEKTETRRVLVPPARPITVKDLLTHTSGLVSTGPLDSDALDVLTLKEAVHTYALSPLQFQPGTRWSYCNPGINTLGRLIEVASGEPYDRFLEKRLFKPLRMKDTTFWPQSSALKKRLATSYSLNEATKKLEVATIKYLTPPYSSKKRSPLAAGGLFSTAEDLLQLYRMLLSGGELNGKTFLSRESISLMTQNHTGDLKAGFTDGMGMGLGFQVVVQPTGVTSTLSAGTYGHGGAHGTQGWVDPVQKTIHILLIQRAGLKNGDASPMREAFHTTTAALQTAKK